MGQSHPPDDAVVIAEDSRTRHLKPAKRTHLVLRSIGNCDLEKRTQDRASTHGANEPVTRRRSPDEAPPPFTGDCGLQNGNSGPVLAGGGGHRNNKRRETPSGPFVNRDVGARAWVSRVRALLVESVGIGIVVEMSGTPRIVGMSDQRAAGRFEPHPLQDPRQTARAVSAYGARLGWGLVILGLLWGIGHAIESVAVGSPTVAGWSSAIVNGVSLSLGFGLAGWGVAQLCQVVGALVTEHVERAENRYLELIAELARVTAALERMIDVGKAASELPDSEVASAVDRTRRLADIDRATRSESWLEAELLISEFAEEFADDPTVIEMKEQLDSSRRQATLAKMAQLDAARQVNDPARVIELYLEIAQVARGRATPDSGARPRQVVSRADSSTAAKWQDPAGCRRAGHPGRRDVRSYGRGGQHARRLADAPPERGPLPALRSHTTEPPMRVPLAWRVPPGCRSGRPWNDLRALRDVRTTISYASCGRAESV